MQIRTRGNTATVTTTCTDGETHQVRFTRDAVGDTVHDPDADAVIAALGGEAHPCQRAINSFHAATALFDAYRGAQDIPDLKSTRNRWTHSHTCTHPNCHYHSLEHFTSPRHLSEPFNADTHTTNVMLKWLLRSIEAHERAPRNRQEAQTLAQTLRTWVAGPTLREHTLLDLVISPAFITAAATVVGEDASALVELRRGGCTVQWLRGIAESTDAAALRRAQQSTRFAASLAAARNAPARAVSSYLNAGITAHFYTYHASQVSPAQVLRVWRGSNQQVTLAALLKDGWTVPQALDTYAAAG